VIATVLHPGERRAMSVGNQSNGCERVMKIPKSMSLRLIRC
jgi:hypothetical protein